jgi:subtilisin family serine protease
MSRAIRVPVFASLLTTFAVAMLVVPSFAGKKTGDAGIPKDYIVQVDGTWGDAQDAAVAAAGGTISYKHAGSGLAIVNSANGSFASSLPEGMRAEPDMLVQWQAPIPETAEQIDVTEDAATLGDETFANAQWNIRAINAQAAWNATNLTGAGVRVAIVDGGLYNSHLDLVGNVDVARSASFVPGFNFNQDVGTFWHATHVAGIVAAADNAIGTIGVAPGATLIGCKALHNGSGSFGAVINAILYAATPIADGGAGANIINMSLGARFPRGGGNTGAGQLVASLNRAIGYATDNGVLCVVSAGNDAVDADHNGNEIIIPAQSGAAFTVAATGPVGYAVGYPAGATNFSRPASYTNFGNSLVNVAAPGGDFVLPGNALCSVPRIPAGTVTTNCWVFDMVMSTVRGSGASVGTYSWTAGTSMAAPAVSGLAALLKQQNPGATVGDLKALIGNSAAVVTTENDPYYGKGFIDALAAVTLGAGPAPARMANSKSTVETATLRNVGVYPNPATSFARMSYSLAKEGQATLAVFDANGRRIKVLANGILPAGDHSVTWDMKDEMNRTVKPGLYFTKLNTAGQSVSNRLVVIP